MDIQSHGQSHGQSHREDGPAVLPRRERETVKSAIDHAIDIEDPLDLDELEVEAVEEARARSSGRSESSGPPRSFPVGLWLCSIPLGILSATAIFLFIGWLQPSLQGNERIALPAVIQFRVAKAEEPPPPPPEEQPEEQPKPKRRKRPVQQRSAARTKVTARPQMISSLTDFGNVIPGGVPMNLDLDAAGIGVDRGGFKQDHDLLARARFRDRQRLARDASYNRQNQALKRFTKPRLIEKFEPAYPREARSQSVEGEVSAKILISTLGAVEEVEITSSTPPGVFEQSVIDAVSQWVFDPAKDETGQAVAFWKPIRLVFRLGR